ncbi:MAG: SCE4755 family polysaccharide monooxygenase-like protein [Deltaproteobacteria bacterium]
MSRFRSISRFAALAGAVQLLAGVASAHIHLLAPLPRYPDAVAGENKNCPCGVGTAGRTCSDPAERSDDNRSTDRATALLGGSLLTVRLSEYVGHSGRFRVAFDPDGADVADFNQHILTDIADPAGKLGNTGNGTLWEIAAQLPNIDCQSCTLQVVQVMNGDTQVPVADTVGQSTYYQCADLQLTRDPSQPEGYAPPFIGPAPAPDPADEDLDVPDAGSPLPARPVPTNTPAAIDSGRAASNGAAEGGATSEGGCNLAAGPSAQASPSLALAAAALLFCGSRRRRRPGWSGAQR